MDALIYDDAKKAHIVDLNSEHPYLTMESHVHPLHVIVNALLKFCDWDPPPSDPPTLAIIDDIHKIWEVYGAHFSISCNSGSAVGAPIWAWKIRLI